MLNSIPTSSFSDWCFGAEVFQHHCQLTVNPPPPRPSPRGGGRQARRARRRAWLQCPPVGFNPIRWQRLCSRPIFQASTCATAARSAMRSEEHTSELQSLMRISYAVFCLKKKKHNHTCNKQLHTQYDIKK